MTSSAADGGSAAPAVRPRRIGIVGGGASGLAAARAFLRANDGGGGDGDRFEVTVLEASGSVGGIWKHDDDDDNDDEGKDDGGGGGRRRRRRRKSRPMYRGLRTNLPKELMAFPEFPWRGGGDGSPSYVTHREVQAYLEEYADAFDLRRHVRLGCRVTHLKVLNDDGDDADRAGGGAGDAPAPSPDRESWPRISLGWTDASDGGRIHREAAFDGVCVCNGHYSVPSPPSSIAGLDSFPGEVLHAVAYDDPADFAKKTVVCVGAHPSGADIAREVALGGARRVYLSGAEFRERKEVGENVVLVPRTRSVDGSTVRFSPDGCGDEESTSFRADGVDVLLFCTGYDYSFPFVDETSRLELSAVPGERNVHPLYEQLWHAEHPSLCFVGLQHKVVAFPVSEYQCAAVASAWSSRWAKEDGGAEDEDDTGGVPLPPPAERRAAAKRDAVAGGPSRGGRVRDTHLMGAHQWDYCRRLARIAGTYSKATEDCIATSEALYEQCGKEKRAMPPGGEDLYRETRFRRIDEERSFEILGSGIQSAKETV